MRFNEKLQMLRKENNYSQEQLADLLDISRQSVSKWESGQTYPEMDKLLVLCKIFNCSLDDLTNDEITVNNIANKSKSQFSNLVDELLSIVKKSINMFKNLKFSCILKVIVELIFIALILLVFKIPFNCLISIGSELFNNFGNATAYNILFGLWKFLIDFIYLILYVIVFVYIYNIVFLDKYDQQNNNKEEKEELPEKELNNKKEMPQQDKKYVQNVRNSSDAFFDGLAKVVIIGIKIFVVFFGMPLIFSLVGFSMGLILSIILLFKGVFYLGIILGFISAIVLNVAIIELLCNFIFDQKIHFKRLIITFIISIIGIGLGIGISIWEFANTTYINTVPDNQITDIVKEEVPMEEALTIDWYYLDDDDITYVVDENMVDTVKVEATYYPEFITAKIVKESNVVYITNDGVSKIKVKDFVDMIIDNLKDKKIYNYSKLSYPSIKVTTSTENINQIKNNSISYVDYDDDGDFDNDHDYDYDD